MHAQEIRSLQEAYDAVYENQQLDEIKVSTTTQNERIPNFETEKKAKQVPGLRVNKPSSSVEEDFDLFDYLLEYLVAEGYADTNKAALAIMANMSEEWKQSIVEGDALQNTIKTLEGKRDAMNANKPGSANTADPGKQSVGAATYKAYQRLRGV